MLWLNSIHKIPGSSQQSSIRVLEYTSALLTEISSRDYLG